MAKEILSVRVEAEVKREAEKVLNELGLNLSTAVNIFLKAVLRENGIPFPLKLGKSRLEDPRLTTEKYQLEKIPPQLEKSLKDLEKGKVEKFPLD